MIEQKPRKQLKLDRHLPQIVIPPKTRTMFINWWNSDIRFETSIPHIFESGYVILEYNYLDIQDELLKSKSGEIKSIAKHYKCTYRNAETMFKTMLKCYSKLTLYFSFINENTMAIEIYDSTNEIVADVKFAVGKSEPEQIIYSDDILFDYGISQLYTSQSEQEHIADNVDAVKENNFYSKIQYILCIVVTAFWYIATTKSTKYIYENKTPIVTGRKKNIVKVSSTKTINTPIYDMNKIRVVSIEKLQTRKKGWTYSNSFQVHGHYRHYKDGKVIFIKPFIKGKGKEFQSQQIIVDPKVN